MQLSFVQSNLLWLFLPSLALAATPLAGQSVTGTSGQLKLVTPQGLNDSDVNRALYCKHNIPDPYDPDDPGWPPELYTTSLNRTLPATPPIDRAFMQRHGFVQNEGEVPFDCLFETLAGYLIFEIKGEVGSDLHVAYKIIVSVGPFDWVVGEYDCNLLNVETEPCAFTIDKKYIKGQGKLYSQTDPKDPSLEDLCVEVEGSVKPPFSRTRSFHHAVCLFKFHRHDEVASTA